MRAVLESEAEIHVVAEARDGLEAVSEAERSLPHVAILDVDLPMSDGARTTATIKARVPECQVLVLSAREDYRSLIEVLDAGASGYHEGVSARRAHPGHTGGPSWRHARAARDARPVAERPPAPQARSRQGVREDRSFDDP